MPTRYVHTNVIARDWRALAEFYTTVFGCEFVPPERDYAGAALDAGTGLRNAHMTGVHLRLPGWGPEGPTLEIYHYDELAASPPPAVNRPGYGHLAFETDDVAALRQQVLAHGGAALGEIVTLTTKTGAQVTWCYLTDPEGNILEIQSWA